MGFLVALAGLIAPGAPHGMMGFTRSMSVWMSLWASCALASAWFPPALLGWALVIVLGMAHAVFCYYRYRAQIRWSWLLPIIALVCALGSAIAVRVFVSEAFKIPSTAMAPTLVIGDHITANKLGAASPERGDVIVYHQPCVARRDYVSRVIAIGGDTVEVRCDIVYLNGKPQPLVLANPHDRYLDGVEEFTGPPEVRPVARYRETLDGRAHDVFEPIEGDRDTADQFDFPRETAPPTCTGGGDDFGANDRQAPGKIVDGPDPAQPCAPHRHYVVPPGHVFVMGDNRHNANDSRFWGAVPVDYIVGRARGIWLPIGRAGFIE